jgi:hypothetical protein
MDDTRVATPAQTGEMFQKLSYLDPLRYMVTIVRGRHIEEFALGGTVAEPARAGGVCDCAVLVQRQRFRKQ